jgi:hypothetical protein
LPAGPSRENWKKSFDERNPKHEVSKGNSEKTTPSASRSQKDDTWKIGWGTESSQVLGTEDFGPGFEPIRTKALNGSTPQSASAICLKFSESFKAKHSRPNAADFKQLMVTSITGFNL